MLPRSIPPAAAPIEVADILAGILATCRNDSVELFHKEIRQYFCIKYSFLLSSGKAALSVALDALSRMSDRREVVIPAFSSFCLPSAVAKAGLNIKLCDISPNTLDFDLDRLKETITHQTLCVIPVHLFGLPAHMDEIHMMAKAKGAFVVEDAAQAAGGRLHNRKLGTIGDIGIFSLGRGKNITTVDGGVIVTNSDSLAAEVQKSIDSIRGRKTSTGTSSATVLKAFALSVFLHPRLYWFPERLPFLKLGESKFSTSFDIARYSRFQAGIGRSMLGRLDRYNAIRRAHAGYLVEHLRGTEGIQVPSSIPGGFPVYLRFPVMVENPAAREMAYQYLAGQGLGVSKTYPSSLHAVAGLRRYRKDMNSVYPGAEEVAGRILTLPVHPYVHHMDLERMVSALRSPVNSLKPSRSAAGQPTNVKSSLQESLARRSMSDL